MEEEEGHLSSINLEDMICPPLCGGVSVAFLVPEMFLQLGGCFLSCSVNLLGQL